MKLDTFLTVCSTYGDPSYDDIDKWKSLKYISTEGQLEPTDFETLYNRNLAYFINDKDLGSGFIFLEKPYAEFEPINNDKKILTFIALTMVNGISFRVNKDIIYDNNLDKGGDENNDV